MYIKQKLFGAKVQGLACTLKGTILNIPINTLHSIKPLTDQSSITKKKKKKWKTSRLLQSFRGKEQDKGQLPPAQSLRKSNGQSKDRGIWGRADSQIPTQPKMNVSHRPRAGSICTTLGVGGHRAATRPLRWASEWGSAPGLSAGSGRSTRWRRRVTWQVPDSGAILVQWVCRQPCVCVCVLG